MPRLVVLNAMDAAARGAEIRVRTEVRSARRTGGFWEIDLAGGLGGRSEMVKARMLINAAGPWVDKVLTNRLGGNMRAHVRLVKGSHIVVPRLFEHGRAYIFQNADRRIVFAIPYQRDFTLIGTTDVDFSGDPANVRIEDDEVSYLCAAVSEYFVAGRPPGGRGLDLFRRTPAL